MCVVFVCRHYKQEGEAVPEWKRRSRYRGGGEATKVRSVSIEVPSKNVYMLRCIDTPHENTHKWFAPGTYKRGGGAVEETAKKVLSTHASAQTLLGLGVGVYRATQGSAQKHRCCIHLCSYACAPQHALAPAAQVSEGRLLTLRMT